MMLTFLKDMDASSLDLVAINLTIARLNDMNYETNNV